MGETAGAAAANAAAVAPAVDVGVIAARADSARAKIDGVVGVLSPLAATAAPTTAAMPSRDGDFATMRASAFRQCGLPVVAAVAPPPGVVCDASAVAGLRSEATPRVRTVPVGDNINGDGAVARSNERGCEPGVDANASRASEFAGVEAAPSDGDGGTVDEPPPPLAVRLA